MNVSFTKSCNWAVYWTKKQLLLILFQSFFPFYNQGVCKWAGVGVFLTRPFKIKKKIICLDIGNWFRFRNSIINNLFSCHSYQVIYSNNFLFKFQCFYHRGLTKIHLNYAQCVIDFNKALSIDPKYFEVGMILSTLVYFVFFYNFDFFKSLYML